METYADNGKKSRFSKNRLLVMEILESVKMPVTADHLYYKLRDENKIISLSTIYRILEKLTLNNIVTKSMILDDNKARFELNKKEHKHYLICTKCNYMTPIKFCPFEEMEKTLQEDTGFYIQGHKLEVYGQCAKCKS